MSDIKDESRRIASLGFDPAEVYTQYMTLLNTELEQAEAALAMSHSRSAEADTPAARDLKELVRQLHQARIELARDVFPYSHPRLAASQVDAQVDQSLTVEVLRWSDDD